MGAPRGKDRGRPEVRGLNMTEKGDQRGGPLLNIADVELTEQKHGEGFEARLGSISGPLGARLLGCRVTVVPPGKRAWPFHSHHANEEIFIILEGEGTLRYGDGVYPIRRGDVVICPPGGPETAHQIVNSSSADLTYLCVSTMNAPDIMEYPDSGKFGAFAGVAPGGDKSRRTFTIFGRKSDAVDYWDGEG